MDYLHQDTRKIDVNSPERASCKRDAFQFYLCRLAARKKEKKRKRERKESDNGGEPGFKVRRHKYGGTRRDGN